MKYKTETHIVIDARKLDILLRLGCDEHIIMSAICGKKIKSTGDNLIDEILGCFVTKKTYTNWGGSRINSGKKPKKLNQVEKQLENQVDTQLGTITITNTLTDNNINNNNSRLSTTHVKQFDKPTLDAVLEYAKQQNSVAGVGGFACSPELAEQFWLYYESQGWVKGNKSQTPICDWKPLLRRWATDEHNRVAAQKTKTAEEPFYL